jgi:nuclear transport factor 2 (NTF2) superfamily protein
VPLRPPVPAFDQGPAVQKRQGAQDAWYTPDPDRDACAHTQDSLWRNRDLFLAGHDAIVKFLRQKVGQGAGLRAPHVVAGVRR